MNAENEIIPGCWECPQCHFNLTKSILFARSGNIGANTEPFVERCPNDGTLMVPKTYKMLCQDLDKLCEQLLREITWLDQHCAFVADFKYNIGPFKIGELRLMAQAGLKADELQAANGQSPL